MSVLHAVHSTNWSWKYYLTHWSVILSNTFVTSSSGILLLLTIDYYTLTTHTTHSRHWSGNTPDSRAAKTDSCNQHQETGSIHKPLLQVFLAIICSFLMNLPRGLEYTIEERCVGVMVNTSSCSCDITGLCHYDASERSNLVSSYPWVVYILASECGLKLLPSLVLATLNWKLIKWYNFSEFVKIYICHQYSLRSRSKMTWKSIIQHLKMRLFKYWRCKRKLDVVTQSPSEFSRENPEKQSEREYNMENTKRLLSFMAVEFIITSSPMAIMNIMTACGFESNSPAFQASLFVSDKFSLKNNILGLSDCLYCSRGFLCSLRLLPFLLVS